MSPLAHAKRIPYVHRWLLSLLILSLVVTLAGCATSALKKPLTTVKSVDLHRFMGDWYVIAIIPYFLEKDCVGSVETYRLRPDGVIDTTFTAWKPDFDGKRIEAKSLAFVEDQETNASWAVQFFWPIRFAYRILALAPDYRYAVVGHPSRNYAWVFARTPRMDPEDYRAALAALDAQGFDTNRLVLVPQRDSR